MKKPLGVWLLACCALVFLMVVTGGVTRLTHSGLSIVEWKPVVGAIPPMGEAAWTEEFAKYQLTPEYQRINAGMSLDEFKSIFWMEYLHRLLGRVAGLTFVLPFLYFAYAGRIGKESVLRLALIALLWAGQGALGWYMVKSGLVLDPHVSHYRLTAHLLAACILYAAMLWTALDWLRPAGGLANPALARLTTVAVGLVFVTIASGGLVAGLRAGLVYPTFPKMGESWLPIYPMDLRPWWTNFFDNQVVVQSDHRVLAGLLTALVAALWARGRSWNGPRLGFHLLMAAVLVQAALGALTLVFLVPVPLAALHQANALLLLGAALLTRHDLTA